MIWAIKKIEKLKWSLFKLIIKNTELIIIKFIDNNPLKPSIKFAPFIINRKHKRINAEDAILFCNNVFKKIKSIFLIWIGKNIINIIRKIIIKTNLLPGLISILKSSKHPIKNKLVLIKMYSYNISEKSK